jgi:hypothetical protein
MLYFLANAGIAKISEAMIDVIMKIKTANVNVLFILIPLILSKCHPEPVEG